MSQSWRGKNKDLVDRLKADGHAPRAAGLKTPAPLMNYIMKFIENPVSRTNYQTGDVPTLWNMWNLWVVDRDELAYHKTEGKLGKLRASDNNEIGSED